jgi:hypothetical protein
VAFPKSRSAAGEVPLITSEHRRQRRRWLRVQPHGRGVTAVETCVVKGVAKLEANTPKILDALDAAAPPETYQGGHEHL